VTLLSDVSGRLGADVVFHSPVATYHGRADVSHLLATIGGVTSDLEPARVVTGEGTRVTFFTLKLAGHDADGVLEETHEDGEIVELRLMLRPLASLIPGVKAMGAALAADPLPSQAQAE
jgi:hypothetical protein